MDFGGLWTTPPNSKPVLTSMDVATGRGHLLRTCCLWKAREFLPKPASITTYVPAIPCGALYSLRGRHTSHPHNHKIGVGNKSVLAVRVSRMNVSSETEFPICKVIWKLLILIGKVKESNESSLG